MNKCDPFYCEGLKRGHIFRCLTFGGGGRVFGVRGVEWVVVRLVEILLKKVRHE